MWSRVLKLDPIYGETAWKSVSVTGLLKKWTSHSAAADFTAPKPDNGLVPLHFQDNKELKKQLIALQNAAGGVGAVATRALGLIEGVSFNNCKYSNDSFVEKAKTLSDTAKQYKDGTVTIANPREEAGYVKLILRCR